MHWYTADLHLNHEAIIRFCKRPFGSASEMDRQICTTISEKVAPNDDLWVVGDFAIARWRTGKRSPSVSPDCLAASTWF